MSGRELASPIELTKALPPRASRLRAVRGWPTLLVTSFVFALFVFVGLFGEWIAPHDPHQQELLARLRPPVWQDGGSWDHVLGTDNLGRDQLSRLIVGTRVSLIVMATAIPASLIVGTTFGLLAGWRRGLWDRLLMRLVDIQLALPAVLFAVLLAAARGPSLWNVVFILVVWGWAGFARVVRAEVLTLRERDFVTAAKALGANDFWIVTRHLVPNVLNIVVILSTLDVAAVILAEAGLSFLGVGVPLTTPSWGGMISQGRSYLTIAWWLVTVPGVAILVVSLCGNVLGDWLRDALEPRMKNLR